MAPGRQTWSTAPDTQRSQVTPAFRLRGGMLNAVRLRHVILQRAAPALAGSFALFSGQKGAISTDKAPNASVVTLPAIPR